MLLGFELLEVVTQLQQLVVETQLAVGHQLEGLLGELLCYYMLQMRLQQLHLVGGLLEIGIGRSQHLLHSLYQLRLYR